MGTASTILVVDDDRNVVELCRLYPVLVDDRQVGALSINPETGPPGLAAPTASSVVSAVNESLIWTGIAAAVLGTLLMALLSGRMLSPVQNLGAAALRLGRGDLSQRAPASGPEEIKRLAASFNAMASNLEEAEQHRRALPRPVYPPSRSRSAS